MLLDKITSTSNVSLPTYFSADLSRTSVGVVVAPARDAKFAYFNKPF
jgi:hypothetical protein